MYCRRGPCAYDTEMTTVLDEASMNEALLQVCEAFGYTSLLPMQEKAIRGMVIG